MMDKLDISSNFRSEDLDDSNMTSLEDSTGRGSSKGDLVVALWDENICAGSDSGTTVTDFTLVVFVVQVKIIFNTVEIFEKSVKIKLVSLWAKLVMEAAEIFIHVEGDLVADLNVEVFVDLSGEDALGKSGRKNDVVL